MNRNLPQSGPTQPTPVTYRGQRFESMSALARHLGTTMSNVSKHLERNGHCERVGINKAPIEFTCHGYNFGRVELAAATLGIAPRRLYKAIKGGPDTRRYRAIADIAGRYLCTEAQMAHHYRETIVEGKQKAIDTYWTLRRRVDVYPQWPENLDKDNPPGNRENRFLIKYEEYT